MNKLEIFLEQLQTYGRTNNFTLDELVVYEHIESMVLKLLNQTTVKTDMIDPYTAWCEVHKRICAFRRY